MAGNTDMLSLADGVALISVRVQKMCPREISWLAHCLASEADSASEVAGATHLVCKL